MSDTEKATVGGLLDGKSKAEAAMEKHKRALAQEVLAQETMLGRVILEIDPELIDPNPLQPREALGDVAELADAIGNQGQLVPLIVVPTDKGRYMVVDGHRRLAALQLWNANHPTQKLTAKANLKPHMTEREQLLAIAATSRHRLDLNPAEEYKTLAAIKEATKLSVPKLARLYGISESKMRDLLALETYREGTIELIKSSKISLGHAEALEQAKDPSVYEALRKYLVDNEGTSVKAFRSYRDKLMTRPAKADPVTSQAPVAPPEAEGQLPMFPPTSEKQEARLLSDLLLRDPSFMGLVEAWKVLDPERRHEVLALARELVEEILEKQARSNGG